MAEWELGQQEWFDHVLVNDDLDRAVDLLVAIIQGFPTSRHGATRATRRSAGGRPTREEGPTHP